ncbi:hypothetical protein BpHYR1_023464 [Brachionus plicatilis]|uniref:Uncharacterized protein n=1 Tax=Brachionus plicatilis TaxID=10195 RepID=A0A3M7PXR7_BRAPC|nr:hypothetical protein BpHYR1_023464 [Brachionus plicatilis]
MTISNGRILSTGPKVIPGVVKFVSIRSFQGMLKFMIKTVEFYEILDVTLINIFFNLIIFANKIGLQNTLQFSAFCTPLKSILINCAIIQFFVN